MDNATLNTLVGLLCWAGLCIIPLGGIAGGVVFFKKRKQNKAAAQVATAPVSPVGSSSNVQTGFAQAYTPVETGAQAAIVMEAAPGESAPATAAAKATAAAFEGLVTPSEIVWLRGDLFSDPAGVLNSEKVLYKDMRVKGPSLALAVLQAAVLALVSAGDARLQPAKRKVLFKEHDTFDLVPTGQNSGWPAGSYEAALLQLAVAQQATGNSSIPVLVYYIIERDSTVPSMEVFTPLKRGLAQRGLLAASKGALGLSVKFELGKEENPAGPLTASRIAALDVEPVRRLLSDFASASPGVNTLLQREIREGIERRRDTSD